MGFQQILLVIIVVLIVGSAVAVGFEMFLRQDLSANRSACGADLQLFLTQIQQIYKMPEHLGGYSGNLANADAAEMAARICWGDEHPLKNDNGRFQISIFAEENYVEIKGIGHAEHKETRPALHGRISFPEGVIDLRQTSMPGVEDFADIDLLSP